MKKLQKIKLQLSRRELGVKDISKTKEEILKVIKDAVKSSKEHLEDEDGGWKLDKGTIQLEILYSLLGFHIDDEINQAFINEGLVIEYSKSQVFVRSEKDYQPIYMNAKTGKLHVVEDDSDKSYIFKFSEKNGYFQIGRL
jgi:hypothetical protein